MDVNRYLNLITSQHREQPKFISFLSDPLTKVDDTVTMLKGMDADFDLDIASGVQLDVLGTIVGVSREVNFQPTDLSSPVMNDTNYKLMIKAKIAQNQWDGTLGGLFEIWQSLFPDVIILVTDNQNMTVDITLIGMGSTMQRDLVVNGYIVPRPQTVKYNFYFASSIIFGFGVDNTYFSGFDVGNWI